MLKEKEKRQRAVSRKRVPCVEMEMKVPEKARQPQVHRKGGKG